MLTMNPLDRCLLLAIAHSTAVANNTLNREAVNRLDSSFGPSRELKAFLEPVDCPAHEVLLNACHVLDIDGLILATRTFEPYNYAQLVVVLESSTVICVADGTGLSMQQRPRMHEVSALFQKLDELGLIRTARMFTQTVPDTSDLAPADVIAAIIAAAKPVPFDLHRFLVAMAGDTFFEEASFRADRS